ncbi:MAG: hypothetical protein E7547_05870 [Ruminococcaceae bacterium]|nr:hypothetical protein [Oscillospiraceae bacterium]
MSNENLDNILENNGPVELSDDTLDAVTGGTGTDTVVTLKYRVGDVVIINYPMEIRYCPSCAKLLKNYEATITGVRGILDGVPIYWITRKCCGYKTSEIEYAIVRKV